MSLQGQCPTKCEFLLLVGIPGLAAFTAHSLQSQGILESSPAIPDSSLLPPHTEQLSLEES